MAITSEDIQNQSFSIAKKGYDVDEVDVFLEHVADEIDFLNDKIANLQNQLAEASTAANTADMSADGTMVMEPVDVEADDIDEMDMSEDFAAALAEKDAIIADLENQLAEKQANDSAISQALIIAQRSADEIIVKANAQASETMQDAREEADRIIGRANLDKQEVVEAIRKLEDDREDTRTEYADLLRDFIEDATAKLNELGYDDDIDAIPDAGDIGIVYEEDVAEFETPAVDAVVPTKPEPVASVHEKDLSGFGDVEDDFEDLD